MAWLVLEIELLVVVSEVANSVSDLNIGGLTAGPRT